jgi:hypothetical protein
LATYRIVRCQDGEVEKLAEVNRELHAIYQVTDAVYEALASGETMDIVATLNEGGQDEMFAFVEVKVRKKRDETPAARFTNTPPEMPPGVHISLGDAG